MNQIPELKVKNDGESIRDILKRRNVEGCADIGIFSVDNVEEKDLDKPLSKESQVYLIAAVASG